MHQGHYTTATGDHRCAESSRTARHTEQLPLPQLQTTLLLGSLPYTGVPALSLQFPCAALTPPGGVESSAFTRPPVQRQMVSARPMQRGIGGNDLILHLILHPTSYVRMFSCAVRDDVSHAAVWVRHVTREALNGLYKVALQRSYTM